MSYSVGNATNKTLVRLLAFVAIVGATYLSCTCIFVGIDYVQSQRRWNTATYSGNTFKLSAEERIKLEVSALQLGDAYSAFRLESYYRLFLQMPEKGFVWLYRAAQLGSVEAEEELCKYGMLGKEKDIFSLQTLSQFYCGNSSELAKAYVKAQYVRWHFGNLLFMLEPAFPHDEEPIAKSYVSFMYGSGKPWYGLSYFCRFPKYPGNGNVEKIMLVLSLPSRLSLSRNCSSDGLVCQRCVSFFDAKKLNVVVVAVAGFRENSRPLPYYAKVVSSILDCVCVKNGIARDVHVQVAGRRSIAEPVVRVLKNDFGANVDVADDFFLIEDDVCLGAHGN